MTIGASMVLVAGCGGGSGGDSKKAATTADTPAQATPRTGRLTDAATGYTVVMPPGWTYPSGLRLGEAVPLGGMGQGCAIGQAGILGDVRGPKLLAFARRTARSRAAVGATVGVEPVKGVNVSGALVRIRKGNQEARSAIFASAGSGVAVTCRASASRAAAQARGLAQLLASVNLRRDRSLERAQAAAVAVPGVQAAALRHDGARVAAQVRVVSFHGIAGRVRDVIAAMAPRLPNTDIGVNVATASAPDKVALGRYLGGTRAGSIQVPGKAPLRFTLR